MAGAEYSVRGVERVAEILRALAARGPCTLSEVAATSGLSPATATRFLSALEYQNLVYHDVTARKYSLGLGLLHLSQGLLRQFAVHTIAEPYLEAVRKELSETSSLSVRRGDFHVVLAASQEVRDFSRVKALGVESPLYYGSAGKVFLADLPPEEVMEYLERTTFVSYSARTPSASDLPEIVEMVRRNGYAISIDESGLGGVGLAAPIRDSSRRVVAAFSISSMLVRFSPAVEHRWVKVVTSAADEISRRLGGA